MKARVRFGAWVVPVIILAGLGAFALVSAACGGDAKVEPTARTFYIQATELDNTRTLTQNPFPQATRDQFATYFGPPNQPATNAGAGGYYLFMPNETSWRIGSYMFIPQTLIAYKGDEITLEILGVRGDHHGNILYDPKNNVVKDERGGDKRVDVNRGELKTISFKAESVGVYRLVCQDHGPTMVMSIHVLPR